MNEPIKETTKKPKFEWDMILVCPYCGDGPKGDQMGCCGESCMHFEEITEFEFVMGEKPGPDEMENILRWNTEIAANALWAIKKDDIYGTKKALLQIILPSQFDI